MFADPGRHAPVVMVRVRISLGHRIHRTVAGVEEVSIGCYRNPYGLDIAWRVASAEYSAVPFLCTIQSQPDFV